MNAFDTVMFFIVIALSIGIAVVTLSLNTKSEGLGAAITGATDTYRGAVGVEEQKRRLLQNLCYTFLGVSLAYAIIVNFV